MKENLSASENAAGVAAIATGVTIGSVGPSVSLSVACTFGVASTGTSIATLSGIAQTNAALAWLGGGTLASGGAGIAGGTLLLTALPIVGGLVAVAGIGWFAYKILNQDLKQAIPRPI